MNETVESFETDLPSPVDPLAAVITCLEQGKSALVIQAENLEPAFFDLSSGVLGEVVRKLTNYHLRMAVLAPDLTVYSTRFQELAREANRGKVMAFFRTSDEAHEWLAANAPERQSP
jgi:hypothetical protein